MTPASDEVQRLLDLHASLARVAGVQARRSTLTTVEDRGVLYPIQATELGVQDPRAPSLVLVGGVHGVERIGTEVVLAYLDTITARLAWDATLRRTLETVRLGFVPLVNPTGMARGTRATARGVDLMRNGPRHPHSRGTPLVGGQRVSPRLPWFAGDATSMEPESEALVDHVRTHHFDARLCVVVDCHSGFGFEDRLWFPYARSREPFPDLATVARLEARLSSTMPNHVYVFEPQATAYTIDGDLWDHVYDLRRGHDAPGRMVPLTLELGSWAWLRKNPRQLVSPLGGFHPVVPHRVRRTLRRHVPLFDFLLAWVASDDATFDDVTRRSLERTAFRRWFAAR